MCAALAAASTPAPTAASSTPSALTPKSLELSRQTLTFKPSRDDLTVGAVMLTLYCPFRDPVATGDWLDAVRVNGARPKTSTLYLRQTAKNQFELPALKIEHSAAKAGGPLYLSIKVWFNELTNQQDSPYYANLPDRYALLTYCTDEQDDPSEENARWGANRAKTFAELKARLGQPFAIALHPRPLPEGSVRWPMVNNARQWVNDADRTVIEQLVRDRGERYLIAVNEGSKENEAMVHVGERNHFEVTRRYHFVREGTRWRIDKTESVETGF